METPTTLAARGTATGTRLALVILTAATVFTTNGCRSLVSNYAAERALTPEEHLTLGVTYEREGELEAALRHYQAAARAELPQAYLFAGNVRTTQRQYEQAERNYRQALRLAPDNADAMNNLAWLYCLQGVRLDEAEALVTKALAADPQNPSYLDTQFAIRHLRENAAAAGGAAQPASASR